MKYPIFASCIVFSLWLMYEIWKHKRKDKKYAEAFWKKEAEADATRAKPLDDLEYIVIPAEILNKFKNENGEYINDDTLPDKIKNAVSSLAHLENAKIVNFTNITNTDLKLSYGAANLPTLTEYDQNYTVLVRTFTDLAEMLIEKEDTEGATELLEFIVATGCDSISIYRMLAGIYKDNNVTDKINYLISTASLLPGITKGPILKLLNETFEQTDKSLEESILDILE